MNNSNKDNVIQVEGLCKSFNDFQIKNISFSLDAGYIMGFIGRNGAGKTSVLKLIQNIIVKDSGLVKICGFDIRKQEIQAKNEIGFVMDSSPFMKHYSLLENGDLFGKYYTEFDRNLYRSYLNRFHLEEEKALLSLSKGMETKFQLAFALAHKPKVLILDEPTDGLDPIYRREFLQLLQLLVEKERMGILFSTHITGDLDRVADYITMIDQGEIVFTMDKETLMDKYRIIKGKKELLQRIPKNVLIGSRVFVTGFEGMTEKIHDLNHYLEGQNFVVERAKLEDVMYYISKGRRENAKPTHV